MFGIIRHYTYDSANNEIIDAKIRGEVRDMLIKMQGFHDYYWLDTGNGEGASVGIWEDKASADLSTEMAHSWVQQNLSMYLTTPPEVMEGGI